MAKSGHRQRFESVSSYEIFIWDNEYFVNDNNDLCLNIPHDNCIELMAPSTLMKIGEKFLQLAATNCTDGGHYNTRSYN